MVLKIQEPKPWGFFLPKTIGYHPETWVWERAGRNEFSPEREIIETRYA